MHLIEGVVHIVIGCTVGWISIQLFKESHKSTWDLNKDRGKMAAIAIAASASIIAAIGLVCIGIYYIYLLFDK